eukprot:m.11722 g.11722  ORF g.11722 m.11722 type:complete len:60 (-) comp7805_c0_seq1:200-379(-)
MMPKSPANLSKPKGTDHHFQSGCTFNKKKPVIWSSFLFVLMDSVLGIRTNSDGGTSEER